MTSNSSVVDRHSLDSPAPARDVAGCGADHRATAWACGAWMGLVVGLAVALRLAWLFQPVRYDEAVTYLAFAQKGFTAITTSYDGPNNHVLHTVLVWLASRISRDEWTLRLPAFIAGCLVPWLTFLVGRRIGGARAALCGAALAAVSVHLVEYSTSARGYSMLVCFSLAQILFADDVVRRTRHLDFALFAVVTALGFYTVPTMLYPTLATAAWACLLALSMRREVRWRRLIALAAVYGVACIALTAALYSPILKQEGGWESLTANRWVEPIRDRAAWWAMTRRYLDDLAFEWSLGFTAPGLVALACLATWAMVTRILRRDVRGLWLSVGIATVAITVFAQRVAPFARVYMYLLPMFLLAAATGLDDLAKLVRVPARAASIVMAAAVLATASYVVLARLPDQSTAADKFPEARAVIAKLDGLLRDGDVVAYSLVPSEAVKFAELRMGRKPRTYRAGASRLVLVARDQDAVSESLRSNRLREGWFGPPRLIESVGGARVYELLPADGKTPAPLRRRENR